MVAASRTLLTLLALAGPGRPPAREAPLERSKPPALSAQILELPAPGPAASTAQQRPAAATPLPPEPVAEVGPSPTAASARAGPCAHGTGVGVFSPRHFRRDRSAPRRRRAAAVRPWLADDERARCISRCPRSGELRRQNLEAVAVARFHVAADGREASCAGHERYASQPGIAEHAQALALPRHGAGPAGRVGARDPGPDLRQLKETRWHICEPSVSL